MQVELNNIGLGAINRVPEGIYHAQILGLIHFSVRINAADNVLNAIVITLLRNSDVCRRIGESWIFLVQAPAREELQSADKRQSMAVGRLKGGVVIERHRQTALREHNSGEE